MLPVISDFFTLAPADTFIDLYCERTAAGLWNEPYNVLSNASFFIAAWSARRLQIRRCVNNAAVTLLLLLTLAIGTGSTLFHMFASRWAEWLDVMPILLFQLAFIWFYCRNCIHLGTVNTVLFLALFLMAGLLAGRDPQVYNGSAAYVPAVLFLCGLSMHHFVTAVRERWLMVAATAIFILSLALRTVDIALCRQFPIGTHFFWHLFIGIVLYLCMRALITGCGYRRTP